ncbi:VOC family protein [Rhizomonospora bruguierae]|uniref:VOC family protein n=1 Tax=Rhizomonospora bruguierae TaxID=1581705 RepID=UPI001BCBB3AD|nr:VOC family protein [Micromonospora sp. NBRC 107566]
MAVDLFAGIPVTDYGAALTWYERFLGCPPSFLPNDTEAVWELAEHRWLYIEQRPDHAGHAMHTIFVDDLDARIAAITGRGLEPAKRETYSNGVRKITYVDPDGNEIGFGGAPTAGL